MTDTVVDASLLAKLVIAEADSQRVRDWYAAVPPDGDLIGPTLLFYETARALQKDGQSRAVHEKLVSGITLVEPTPDIWRYLDGVTFYDASYLQLAKARGASLATTDDKMRAAAKKHGIGLAFP